MSGPKIRVGLGRRTYNHERVAYGLGLEGVVFSKAPYIPWNRLSQDPRVENTYYFAPFPRHDIVHLWNGILLNRRPFITSFESYLPRVFNGRKDIFYRTCMRRLESSDCRRLLAMSDFARRFFVWQHGDTLQPAILDKLDVHYGGVAVPEGPLARRLERLGAQRDAPLKACFIGHEFFRKGGLAVLRAFERLAAEGLDAKLAVVSRVLAEDYVSHESQARADEVKARLQCAPWAEWHESLPHSQVMNLIADSDVGLLPTLDDTFGWSTLEAMSCGLPVISTNVCALPEIVVHDYNGLLIPLDLAANRRWVGFNQPQESEVFSSMLLRAYEQIEEGIVAGMRQLHAQRSRLEQMSANAVTHVSARFDPAGQGRKLVEIYRSAL